MLLLLRLEDGEGELRAQPVIELPQLLQLGSADVQLPAVIQTDAVDDQVGVYVIPVGVGADQNLTASKVICQLHGGGMGSDGIYRRPLREAVHQVVEHGAALFVVQQLGVEEVGVGALRPAIDAGDQLLSLPLGFLILHGVLHDGGHAGPALPLGVVSEMDDAYFFHLPRSAISCSVLLMSPRA